MENNKIEEKEEKYEDKVQSIIQSQMKEIKEETKKEKISLILDKVVSLNIIEFIFQISIPEEKSQENYKFLLEINLIYNKIHLYSINIKEISDGRDLYYEIMKENNIRNDYFNKDKFNLKLIVKNLKLFVQNLSENLKNSKNIGKFYLAEEYDITFIKGLNYLTKIPCRHVEYVKGRKIVTPSLCCISNEYFILYEYGNSSNKYLTNDEYKFTLVFYAPFESLTKFNKLLEGSAVTLYWKKQIGEKDYYLKLESDIDSDMNKIIELLIGVMKQSGVKLDIKEKRYGELPNINIKEIEQEISKYELELQNNGNKEIFNNLIKAYEDAVVFYSAINDSQYVTYSTRVKELLKNEKYSKYLS
jgi:hypothetical protein